MSTNNLGFVHQYIPGSQAEDTPTLLLLHGTGGTEEDLLGLGQALLPGANLLSPRGKILEHGMPRFFRRLAEGVFDLEDLKFRTHELADFVAAAATEYGFDPTKVIALGYSNGANIAASTLLLRPGVLSGAVLLRAMVPLEPEAAPDLSGVNVFLASGTQDQMVPKSNVDHLASMLTSYGAQVTHRWQPGGHGLANPEIVAAKEWLTTIQK